MNKKPAFFNKNSLWFIAFFFGVVLGALWLLMPEKKCPTIVSFKDIHGLSDLTRAFFSKQEYVGEVAKTGFGETVLTKKSFDGAVNAFAMRLSGDVAFHNPEHWLGTPVEVSKKIVFNKKFDEKLNLKVPTTRYVQKLKIDHDATVCFMGDYHGSIHSLMRNLWRLVALGHLNEDLTIKNKKFYMVFLGDYVDHGRWGAEVLTTIIKLKLQNWNNVHVVAGNHETGNVAIKHSFGIEVLKKFGDKNNKHLGCESFENVYAKVFMNLPAALFIECENNFIQCCHGGIERSYNPLSFLKDPEKLFQNVGTEEECLGLFWSEFCAGTDDGGEFKDGFKYNTSIKKGISANQKCTFDYLQRNSLNNEVGLRFIMRAHMDMEFGLKMFLKKTNKDGLCLSAKELLKTQPQSHAGYMPGKHGALTIYQYQDDCLYHWTEAAQRCGISDNKFPLSMFAYYPVFTFTTAVEPREFPFDCFGLMHTAQKWDDWMMTVYELFLDKQGSKYRRDKFVHIGPASSRSQTNLVEPMGKQGQDPIEVIWQNVFEPNKLEAGMKMLAQ